VNGFNVETPEGATSVPKRPLVNRGRASLVHGSLVLFAFALIARAVQVQLVDGKTWAAKAERQQVSLSPLLAQRGQILDERGVVLVDSHEVVLLSIAPPEVRRDKKGNKDDGPKLAKSLAAIGVPRDLIRKSLDTRVKWVTLPKPIVPRDAEPILSLRYGIHPTYGMQRVNAAPVGIRKLIGVIDDKGAPIGGIEQAYDSLLRGQTGERAGVKDGRGNVFESPARSGIDATPGHSISLTINATLQEICERELAAALERTGSTGGDVVIVDPRDGAILALAGYRNGKPPLSSTPLAEGYEPGSVLKPFVVARLLDRHIITPDDIVNTENGRYTINKRTITDEHIRASMSVRDVIRFSSNIGIVKLASKFSAAEEYELLRDFGFGVQPGTPYPAESRGRVPLPRTWSAQTSASLAMGYEMLATPLQLAEAYASVANGGELLQPALIREVRDGSGAVVYRHQRQVLRRVMSPEAAEKVRIILESVVDSGTATAAELKTFDVAGKTGTARRAENGHYDAGHINATFAGMFPAKKPQYVIVARLIDPKGEIFGGLVAAPVVNRILQAAVASRDVRLDRSGLAVAVHQAQTPVTPPHIMTAAGAKAIALAERDSLAAYASDTGVLTVVAAPTRSLAPTHVVPVQLPMSNKPVSPPPPMDKLVPNVHGLDVRDAIRTLHSAGFEVRLVPGVSGRTKPTAGTALRRGTTVILEAGR
jgi:cell division protein FtsI (penicillin-binding protein 3)